MRKAAAAVTPTASISTASSRYRAASRSRRLSSRTSTSALPIGPWWTFGQPSSCPLAARSGCATGFPASYRTSLPGAGRRYTSRSRPCSASQVRHRRPPSASRARSSLAARVRSADRPPIGRRMVSAPSVRRTCAKLTISSATTTSPSRTCRDGSARSGTPPAIPQRTRHSSAGKLRSRSAHAAEAAGLLSWVSSASTTPCGRSGSVLGSQPR
nr:hypothetical protein [Actinoplanes subtropicus]